MIDEAIRFLMKSVFDPAMDSERLDRGIKNKISHTKNVISKYRKIGDLHKYLKKFQESRGGGQLVFAALEKEGLDTFESVYPEFVRRFSYYLDDHTMLSDFIVGNIYNSFDIAFAAGKTDVRQGIYIVGQQQPYQAVLIKANLDNGKYANEWLVEGRELKYYLKSIGGVFKRSYKENAAIIESSGLPIYVFIKNGTECKFSGQFSYSEVIEDSDGSLWFRLVKSDVETEALVNQADYLHQLELDKKRALRSNSAERKERLRKARKKPKPITVVSTNYRRNPDVISEVLERANGVCENCNNSAPFIRASDNTPYLEVHHKIRLADEGDDTVENAIAVCPNCHRYLHFG